MNCIIVDDEATARAIIRQLCTNVNGLNVVEEFSNAIQAMKYLNQNEVDLIFLDIHMPDFTGFDFIQSLKHPPKMILTTSDSNFAIQAFEYDCIVDYLIKPLLLPRFKKAIEKAKSASKMTNTNQNKSDLPTVNDLYVNINKRLIKIDINSICVIESKGDYILIKTEEEKFTVHSTLMKIEEKLPKHLFLKVHRSFIINVTKIVDIKDNSVLVKKDVIPVSRSNRPELIKRLNLL